MESVATDLRTLLSNYHDEESGLVYIIIDWLVDSGCAVSVACKFIEEFLQDKVESSLWLNGFSTKSSERADLAGKLCMYVLSGVQGAQGSSLILDNINTVANARLNLLSFTELFNTHMFDAAFSHDGFTGFHKLDRSTGERIELPFYHRKGTNSWHMYTVVAGSIEETEQAAAVIETSMARLDSGMVLSALIFEQHATRVIQALAGNISVHHSGKNWNASIDLINLVTDFNAHSASSYLSQSAFADCLATVLSDCGEVPEPTSYVDFYGMYTEPEPDCMHMFLGKIVPIDIKMARDDRIHWTAEHDAALLAVRAKIRENRDQPVYCTPDSEISECVQCTDIAAVQKSDPNLHTPAPNDVVMGRLKRYCNSRTAKMTSLEAHRRVTEIKSSRLLVAQKQNTFA